MEVERKWLVVTPPAEALARPADPIDQGYLVVGADGEEVRLRRRGRLRYLTAKAGHGLVRDEYEVELTAEQYDTLWPGTAGRRLEKTRRVLPAAGGLSIELDQYAGDLVGLFTAEVEFPDEASARAYRAPAWFGRDVTEDEAYRNRRLAERGRPIESPLKGS